MKSDQMQDRQRCCPAWDGSGAASEETGRRPPPAGGIRSGRRRRRGLLRSSSSRVPPFAAAVVLCWVAWSGPKGRFGTPQRPQSVFLEGCTAFLLPPCRTTRCVPSVSTGATHLNVATAGSSVGVPPPTSSLSSPDDDSHVTRETEFDDTARVQRHDEARKDASPSLSSANEKSAEAAEDPASSRSQHVRFVSPLLEYGYRPAVDEWHNGTAAQKPLLLYLPGFDGTFLSPFLQFPELGTVFDVRCMVVPMDDRSTFYELKDAVLTYLRSQEASCQPPLPLTKLGDEDAPGDSVIHTSSASSPAPNRNPLAHMFGGGGRPSAASSSSSLPSHRADPNGSKMRPPRPVYLAGESFGGILAVEVATSLLEEEQPQSASVTLRGLALINAATCYDRSRLAALGPSVAEYHPWLYSVGLVGRLLPLFTDEHSFRQLLLILRGVALPSVIDDATREAYLGRVALSLPFVLPVMTQDALQWRLHQWLAVGCEHLVSQNRLGNLASLLRRPKSSFKVLVVAGENDAALPSIAEAERLASVLPGALVHVVEGAGHASTCGSRVDLAALFRRCYPDDLLVPRGETGAPQSSSSSSSNSVLWQWGMHRAMAGHSSKGTIGRTEMKPIAAAGVNEYFGMEPRYDNATIGLSPLRYWSSKYYRKYEPAPIPTVPLTSQQTEVAASDSGDPNRSSNVAEVEPRIPFSSAASDAANESIIVSESRST